MEFDRLYLLGSEFLGGALHVQPVTTITNHSAIFRGDSIPASPLVFAHQRGGAARDLISTGFPALMLLSSRVFEILRAEGITGWTTFPVVVTGKDRQVIDGYRGLSITGRCGSIRKERSKLVWKEPRYAGGPPRQVKLGLLFDPATWTGHDMFSPQGVDYVFVGERVKDVLEQAKVKNIRFERLTEVENVLP